MEGQIFGSDITLPSLPGLQSDCEEEILLLMKEVDLEFQRRHEALLTELINVRSLCRAQRDEIENMRCILQPRTEAVPDDNLKEKVKEYCTEIKKLKKENDELRTDNSALGRKVQMLSESVNQIESFRRSLSMQQEENKILRERLTRVEQKYQSLQNNYKRVVNGLVSFSQSGTNEGGNPVEFSSTSQKEAEIAQTTEKFLSEEKELCNEFLSKMNRDIDELERKLQKEVS